MGIELKSQPPGQDLSGQGPGPAPVTVELIVPNPKLKLLDQVREVMRLGMVESRELMVDGQDGRCGGSWIRRYNKFHGITTAGATTN